jgi:hypothetical protein
MMRQRSQPLGLASFRPAVIGLGRAVGLGLSAVRAAPLNSTEHGYEPEETDTPLWVLGVASMALVLLGGAFAGLTIAYVHPTEQAWIATNGMLTGYQAHGPGLHLPPSCVRRSARAAI